MYTINTTLIIPTGPELDHQAADKIRKEFETFYKTGCVKNVLFDMEGLEFMDSSGIGMIMGRYRKIVFYGGRIGLVNVPDRVGRMLKMAGIFTIATLFENVEEACISFEMENEQNKIREGKK